MTEGAVTAAPDPATPPARRGAAVVRALRTFDGWIQSGEVVVCVLALGLMIALSFAQAIMRKLQGGGIQAVGWFDTVARLLVLWVGLPGASLATAEGRHIAIEALPKLFGPVGRQRLRLVTSAAALAVTGLLCWLSWGYLSSYLLKSDRPLFVIEALGQLEVPQWPFFLIVPLGLGLMCWRFGLGILEVLFLDPRELQDAEAALEAEMEAFEHAHEQQEAALLLDHDRRSASGSGRAPQLDSDSARERVRSALRSDRWDQGPPARHDPLRLVGRTTDELPAYRGLGDEADLLEPEARLRAAAAREREQQDLISSDSDLSAHDVGLAEDAVESLADTRRVEQPSDELASEEQGGDEGRATGPANPIDTEQFPRQDFPPPAEEAS